MSVFLLMRRPWWAILVSQALPSGAIPRSRRRHFALSLPDALALASGLGGRPAAARRALANIRLTAQLAVSHGDARRSEPRACIAHCTLRG
jgi:hypothetical protein